MGMESDVTSGRAVHHDLLRHGVSIFVYELPPDVAFRFGRHIDPNYYAEWAFIDTLLSDWAIRTLDPEAADLFLVPFLNVFGVVQNRMCDRARFELAVEWIQAAHPFYNRSQGRDHVFFFPGDRGPCGIGATNPIIVHHYGLTAPFRATREAAESGSASLSGPMQRRSRSWSQRRDGEELRRGPSHRHPIEHVPGRLSDMAQRHRVKSSSKSPSALAAAMEEGEWCHAPHKDVVAPPYVPKRPVFAGAGYKVQQRTVATEAMLLFHAGGIWGAQGTGPRRISYYSSGVRQRLFMTYGNDTSQGILIMNKSAGRQFKQLMARHRFCLAPSGDGWGMRFSLTMVQAGCLPLVMQPLIEQPLESVLDLPTFSRRV